MAKEGAGRPSSDDAASTNKSVLFCRRRSGNALAVLGILALLQSYMLRLEQVGLETNASPTSRTAKHVYNGTTLFQNKRHHHEAAVDSVFPYERVKELLLLRERRNGREMIAPSGNCAKRSPTHVRLNHTLFLHVGKAGGGTFQSRLNQLRVCVDECHPDPCPRRVESKYQQAIVVVRDPVDRFASAFNWRSFKLCNPHNESRTANSRLVETDPVRYCKQKSTPEADILHTKYKADPNALAAAFCDANLQNDVETDIDSIRHMSSLVSGWMPRQESWYIGNLVAVVLEKGFDFVEQIDAAVLYQIQRNAAGPSPTKLWMENYANKTGANKVEIPLSQQHSTKQWKQRTIKLSEYSKCCVARYYEADYQLLELVADWICRGSMAHECNNAITAILARRKRLLDKTKTCTEIAGR